MRYALVLLALVMLSGCAAFKINADYRSAAAAAKDKNYQEAVAIYNKIAVQAPQSGAAPESLFQAAYLQTLYDNPQRDYAKALQGFDEFIKRYPGHPRLQEARNWHSLLKTILDLKKENDRLKKNIEQLKKLDIRHEERRGR